MCEIMRTLHVFPAVSLCHTSSPLQNPKSAGLGCVFQFIFGIQEKVSSQWRGKLSCIVTYVWLVFSGLSSAKTSNKNCPCWRPLGGVVWAKPPLVVFAQQLRFWRVSAGHILPAVAASKRATSLWLNTAEYLSPPNTVNVHYKKSLSITSSALIFQYAIFTVGNVTQAKRTRQFLCSTAPHSYQSLQCHHCHATRCRKNNRFCSCASETQNSRCFSTIFLTRVEIRLIIGGLSL